MKAPHILMSFLVSIFIAGVGFAQSTGETEPQRLSRKAYELVQQKRYLEALDTSERVLKLEEEAVPAIHKDTIVAALNLARLKRMFYEGGGSIKSDDGSYERLKIRSLDQLSSEIEAVYRKAIVIYESRLPAETLALAGLKFELADFISPEKGSLRTETSRFRRAETLYQESVASLEKSFGLNEKTIVAMLRLADFYQIRAEFEKSLPLYLRVSEALDQQNKSNSQLSIRALREVALILATAEQTAEATKTINRIIQLSGKTEVLPAPIADISSRTREDHTGKMMSDPNTITSYRKKLKAIPVSVVIAINGSVVEAISEPSLDKTIDGKEVKSLAEKQVFSWKFRPFVLGGNPVKIRGKVLYFYLTKS